MSSSCPNCGAEITFRWSSAVQTTCPFCRSILVRRDVDLKRVGVVSDLPTTSSPIQLGTEGRYKGQPFAVVGRIVYEYERGHWNEWHIRLGDASAWLSDALGEYAISHEVPTPPNVPATPKVHVGESLQIEGTSYTVTTITNAGYVGVEGELPFEYWDKTKVPFVDLESTTGRFATIDYSDAQPLLFVGEYQEFDQLQLGNLRETVQEAAVRNVTGLNCPKCGAAITLRSGELAQTVACPSCAAVLDAKDPNLRVLQEYQGKMRWTPAIPLGTTGKIKGDPYQLLGFQVRGIRVDDVDYDWREYLLWNQSKGFRYLTEYDGHWNDVVVVKGTPHVTGSLRPAAEYIGETFRHFQTAEARTKFVLGEFPWEVRLGDKVQTRDFVAPPHMLSEETTADETTWSLGTYVSPQYIWETFQLPGKPPAPRGIYEDQPDPNEGNAGAIGRIFAVFAVLLLGLLIVRQVTARRDRVFSQGYTVFSHNPDSTAFVTPVFALNGRTSNVRLTIDTDLRNNWAYFNLALINDQTGTAYDFGREVSYYFGYDDGYWSEGSTSDRATIPSVPSGQYYLRVQPELGNDSQEPLGFNLTVQRDMPSMTFFAIVFGLLLVPPVLAWFRYYSFEQLRWRESDYAPVSSDEDE